MSNLKNKQRGDLVSQMCVIVEDEHGRACGIQGPLRHPFRNVMRASSWGLAVEREGRVSETLCRACHWFGQGHVGRGIGSRAEVEGRLEGKDDTGALTGLALAQFFVAARAATLHL